MRRPDPSVPDALRARYAEWVWTVVCDGHPGSVVFRIVRGEALRYVKLAREGAHPTLAAEADRLRWAGRHLPVPEVVEHGRAEGTGWLVTTALPGVDATAPALTTDPSTLVPMLARGLLRFHEAPAELCPFDFRLDAALAWARHRLASGAIDPDRDFHEEHAHLSAAEAVDRLERTRPAAESLVVCHGDYCLPNVMVRNGVASGFVDLGELGVADRWWDLAVATWSVTWNLGPGHEEAFLDVYGVRFDADRLAFYRLLYDVVS